MENPNDTLEKDPVLCAVRTIVTDVADKVIGPLVGIGVLLGVFICVLFYAVWSAQAPAQVRTQHHRPDGPRLFFHDVVRCDKYSHGPGVHRRYRVWGQPADEDRLVEIHVEAR